jgi:hypothetical protein
MEGISLIVSRSGFGRKWSWLISKYYPCILLATVRNSNEI